jgi:hypothetical protein
MMYDRKNVPFKSPDLEKLQAVAINLKTTIYIALGADPGEARKSYFKKLLERRP